MRCIAAFLVPYQCGSIPSPENGSIFNAYRQSPRPKKTPILGKAGIGAHCVIFNLTSKPIFGVVSIAGSTIEAESVSLCPGVPRRRFGDRLGFVYPLIVIAGGSEIDHGQWGNLPRRAPRPLFDISQRPIGSLRNR